MTRLPRTRGGKTPVDVDVVVVEQDGLKRVRLTMGAGSFKGSRNTDMDVEETEDLITLLEFKLQEIKQD